MNQMMVRLCFLLAISVSLGVGIMVQQYFVWHHVWDVAQTMHHEFFASVLFAFSFGIGITIFTLKRRKRK
jgi:hypothetical protein